MDAEEHLGFKCHGIYYRYHTVAIGSNIIIDIHVHVHVIVAMIPGEFCIEILKGAQQ